MPLPKKNTAYTFNLSLVDRANRPQFRANPTLALGDFKVSTDGGAFANLGTTPTVEPATSTNVKVVLSAGEMNGDRIVIQAIDAAGAEWDDVVVYIDTTTATVDDLVRSTTPANALTVDASGNVKLQATTHTGATIPTVTTVTNRVTANTDQIAGSSTAATNLSNSASTIIVGSVDASPAPTTTSFADTTNLTSTVTDFYKGRVIIFVTGNLAKQATAITAYNGTTHAVTVSPALTSAPASSDTYVVV